MDEAQRRMLNSAHQQFARAAAAIYYIDLLCKQDFLHFPDDVQKELQRLIEESAAGVERAMAYVLNVSEVLR